MEREKKFIKRRDGQYQCSRCGHVTRSREGAKSHYRRKHSSPTNLKNDGLQIPPVIEAPSPQVTTAPPPTYEDFIPSLEDAPLDEKDVLRTIFKKAGVVYRAESIIDTFFASPSTDNLQALDSIMSLGGVVPNARKLVLLNWADVYGIPKTYIEKKYQFPQIDGTPTDNITEQGVKPSIEKDPLDSMIAMMEKRMKMQQMMMMMQSMERMDRGGYMMDTSGQMHKPDPPPVDEKRMRVLDDGSSVEMTDRQWVDYRQGAERLKVQQSAQISKKEIEKIPLKLEDGTVVNIPSDQVDKYMFLTKSMQPDQRKDTYEIVREMEKQRTDLEKRYQQENQTLRDQNMQQMVERLTDNYDKLRQQFAYRPDPIKEMVDTQQQLKEAGIVKPEGERSMDQHTMAINEKKLDTTMALVLQQQSSTHRKVDQLLGIMMPVIQDIAQKGAKKFVERRAEVQGQEVLPYGDQELQNMAQQLDEEIPAPPPDETKPRKSKVLTAGE